MREFELIAKLGERAGEAGAASSDRLVLGGGDDAAVTVPGGATVTSVDMLVEGVHFRRETTTLREVGRKALSTALSDLAAMGADPGEAYVALGVPADLDEAGALELYGGLAEVAADTRTALAGGDISAAPALTVSMTVVGHLPSAELAVGRAGARPGHVLAVTGRLGGAAAGLMLLERPGLRDAVAPEIAAELVRRLNDPTPRLAAGAALAAAGAAAMIDLSDGLGADAGHVAEASDAWLRIDLGRLPLQVGVAEVAAAAGADPLDLASGGGEDYELLVAIGPESFETAAAATRQTGVELAAIGEVTAGAGVELRGPHGGTRPPSGFDQLDTG